MRWKLLGLAGVAGVAASGVVAAQKRREHADYSAEALHERLGQSHNGAGPPAETGEAIRY